MNWLSLTLFSARTIYRMFKKGLFDPSDLPMKGKRKPNGHQEKPQQVSEDAKEYLASLQAELTERDIVQSKGEAGILHPLEVINTLQSKVTDDMTVTVDVGSHYIWMARHFRSYEPRHLLFSNGMQTLGVALPWAISAALVRPNTQIVSVSGDGGFLFSAQDLETAVRKKLNIVHLIWNDGHYKDDFLFNLPHLNEIIIIVFFLPSA
ncbi:hypothetical protein EfmAA290_17270 [Enterococcus faecium]|nr:hypothetical protein EfmAA290_17270 [Enterococcus faecium]